MRSPLMAVLGVLWLGQVQAAAYDYHLNAQDLGEGVHVFVGALQHFNRDNGGNIVNTGFIETPAGAVVIDTGSSRLYGEQQRAWIEAHSRRGIARIYVTHAHPDHFLGNQAYAGIPIFALPDTRAAILSGGDLLTGNLYRLIGQAMSGTQVLAPGMPAGEGSIEVGGRRLRLIAAAGHTSADLAIYDESSATLFAGDLVFYERTATTPNADIARWLATLARLEALPYKTLVPGHGPVVQGTAAIAQTRDYLRWLQTTLHEAADHGVDLPELLDLKLPERFARLAVARAEWARTVQHLYPEQELRSLGQQESGH